MPPTQLSEGDRAIWREIAFEVAEIVVARHVKQYKAWFYGLLVGISIGAGTIGGAGGFTIAKLLMQP